MPTHDAIDRERLERLLGGPELARLRERLRARFARGDGVSGRLALSNATPAERRAIDALLGRVPRHGATPTFEIGDLEAALARAFVSPSLRAALEVLDGPITSQIDARRARDARLDAARATIESANDEALRASFEETVSDGLLARLLGPALDGLEAVTAALVEISSALADGDGQSRAELAARVTGDAHGLDPNGGHPAHHALTQRYLQHRSGLPAPADAEERRALWASAGIEPDALAASVLALCLDAPEGGGPVAAALRAHRAAGEPIRMTGRSLRRAMPELRALEGVDVFVCENPSIVLAAARELGAASAPLVCTEGQPNLAVTTLLTALASAGARLRYHGDFDWPGLRIASAIMDRHGARPWRFGPDDYHAAPGGSALGPRPAGLSAPWSPTLVEAMEERGVAVHEEVVVPALIADLGAPASSWT